MILSYYFTMYYRVSIILHSIVTFLFHNNSTTFLYSLSELYIIIYIQNVNFN